MAKITINRVCNSCAGTGITQYYGGPELVCSGCDGDGEVVLADFGNQHACFTYQILEATDVTEYGALSDSNKNAYDMLLKCGIVDLSEGTQVRTNLWSMFDSESTTRANLITLLGE